MKSRNIQLLAAFSTLALLLFFALRLTARLGFALLVACVIGVGVTWAGVLLAYDSYYWGTSRQGFPVSFFIVALVFLLYLASGLARVRAVTARRERAVLQGAGR